MDNEIKKIKSKLQVISPLLLQSQLILEDMVMDLKHKSEELDESRANHDYFTNRKIALIQMIQSKINDESDQINIYELSNARNYLFELDKSVENANQDLRKKEDALDKIKSKVNNQSLSMKGMAEYKNKKIKSLSSYSEKKMMLQLDELFLQKVNMGLKNE